MTTPMYGMEPPQHRTKPEKLLLSLQEACDLMGISISTGYVLLEEGKFPVSLRRIGSRWKISRLELMEWLKNPQPDAEDGTDVSW
jgi:excisionase family DNA binding protein